MDILFEQLIKVQASCVVLYNMWLFETAAMNWCFEFNHMG